MLADSVRIAWEALKAKDAERRLVQRTLVKNAVTALVTEGGGDLEEIMEAAGFSPDIKEEECGGFLPGMSHTHSVQAKDRFARCLCRELYELITERTQDEVLEDGR